MLSPWLKVVSFGADLLGAVGKTLAEELVKKALHERHLNPMALVALRDHFADLSASTAKLIEQTKVSTQSQTYYDAREHWTDLFAPALAALHNLDPSTMAALRVYTPRLGELLKSELSITASTLSQALKSEQEEITFDDNAHLCTLCLFIVRQWSESHTMLGGLQELTQQLSDSVVLLDTFITTNWKPSDLVM